MQITERPYQINNQAGVYFVTFSVVQWVDVFTRREYRDIVLASLKYCQQSKGLILYGWCLMSNHIHLILAAKESNTVSGILRDFKKFTSKRIIESIEDNEKESRKSWMLWLFSSSGKANLNNHESQFWQQGNNHAVELFTPMFSRQKLDYIHLNPVRAGIVENPQDYLYSSARNYADLPGLLEVEFLF